MNQVKIAVFAACAPFLCETRALASYDMPSRDFGLNLITTIVDATVTGFSAENHALIHVNHVLVGQFPPSRIIGVVYTCFQPNPPRSYGVEAGRRYVFLLVENRMFEEKSYFPCRGEGGKVIVDINRTYQKWLGLPGASTTIDALKAYLVAESEKAQQNKEARARALRSKFRLPVPEGSSQGITPVGSPTTR